MAEILAPGVVCEYDFRPQRTKSVAAAAASSQRKGAATKSVMTLKVVQWNIERGYQIERILATLKTLDADVLLLQELDVGCRRTNYFNVPEMIARHLEAHVVFVAEFQELDSLCRSTRDAAGPRAFHGNAIVSRTHKLTHVRAFAHSANHDWSLIGPGLREPRRGCRYVLTAAVETAAHYLHLACLHLEVFCGPLMRAQQLSDAVYDARMQQTCAITARTTCSNKTFHAIIAGDLNTHAHSIVRLSSRYGTDRMKLLGIGETEAEWLVSTLLDPMRGPSRNPMLGLTQLDRLKIDNRELLFYDPFDLVEDITLDHPDYWGFARGKLDWLLLSNVSVRSTDVGNHDFAASDHKYIAATVILRSGTSPAETFVRWKRSWKSAAFLFIVRYVMPLVLSVLCVYHCWCFAPRALRPLS